MCLSADLPKKRKNDQLCRVTILCVFTLVLLIIRAPYGLISDDEVVSATISSQSLIENFWHRWNYNGRIITDVFANVFYRMPMAIWKLFDAAVYIYMALSLSKTFTKNTCSELFLVCSLILLFPMDYLSSAGYIATSTNYVYTVAALIGVLYFLCLVQRDKQPSNAHRIYIYICVIYVTNHDQTAMILLGGLLLYLLYCIYKKNKKSIITSTLKLLVFSVACYVVMFLIPGHLYRMHDASEMEFWFPQYASWSFSKKLYHGFSTTVANLFFSDVKIFILFALIIFLLGVSQKTWLKTIIASIPLTLIVSSRLVGTDKFVVYYEYSCGMPDLLPLTVTVMPFLISIVAVVSIFYTVYSCVDEEKNKWTILLFLFLAAGSREMMGLSATIYASSFRTFTAFLYLIMMACLVLLGELNRNSNCALWFSAVGAIPIMLVLQLLQ